TRAMLVLDQFKTFRALIAAAKASSDDPQSVQEARNSINWAEWLEAIKDEYQKLVNMGTLLIVDPPTGRKILKGKLVFKTKRDQNSRIEKFKARFVAKGYEQQYGRDYDQTYASTCHSATWKIIIALAAICGWSIEQMDAISAFLHSHMV